MKIYDKVLAALETFIERQREEEAENLHCAEYTHARPACKRDLHSPEKLITMS